MQSSEEARAESMGEYVKHKVGDVVGTVKEKVGWNWGGARVAEAEAELPNGREIEYVRVRPAGAGGDTWESLKEQ